MSDWTKRYLDQAEFVALNYSKDKSTKVGCIIVSKDNSILSQGYNGFSRGIDDSEFRLNNRSIKYEFIVHAENNAIYNAAREGIKLLDSTLYLYSLPPCNNCANAIVQSGIKKVYIRLKENVDMTRWVDAWDISQIIFKEAKVKWEII